MGMPYKVVGGVRFYERREVRDALAYLRSIANPGDGGIPATDPLNVPKRGIGDRAEAAVEQLAERERITFDEALHRAEEAPGLATRSLNAITAFVEMMDALRTLSESGADAPTVLQAVLEQTGYVSELQQSADLQRRNEDREPRGTRVRRPGVRSRTRGIHPGGVPRTDRACCRFG